MTDHRTDEKGIATMKLTTTTNRHRRRSDAGARRAGRRPQGGGFERGGWAMVDNDDENMGFLNDVYGRANAFLFGRRTYEIFAGSWGTWDDPGDSPIWTALNTSPKYVASTTLTDPRWADTTVLSGDVAAAIRDLKAEAGGELQVHGSGVLVRWLLDNDLIDEMNLLVYPVVVGQGTRLFPDTGPDVALELVDLGGHPQRSDDPGLPPRRAPAVRGGHARREIGRASRGPER